MSFLKNFLYAAYGRIIAFFIFQKDRLPLWLPVVFGAGTGFYFSLRTEPLFSTGLAFFLCGCFLLYDCREKKGLFLLSLFVFLFFTGFFLTQIRTSVLSAPKIKFHMSSVDLKGTVQDVVELPEGRSRITVNDIKIETMPKWKTPKKIRLNLAEDVPVPQTGDEIEVTAVLNSPQGAHTPTGFDFARDLYFKEIGAVGKVSALTIVKPAKRFFEREAVNKRIDAVLPETTKGVAKALVTGSSKSIPLQITGNYRDAGISHILAVSGFHMSFLAGLIFFAVRSVLALIPRISLYYNTKKIAAVCALLCCFFYLHISGASYATQRAFIMIAFILTATLLNRHALSVVSVAWAAFFILLFTPEALFSAGFQLSFAAVTALICAYEAGINKYVRLSEKKSGIVFFLCSAVAGTLAASLIAGLAVAPFTIYHFRRLPLYSALSSLICTPLTGFWILPALAFAVILMPFGADKPFLMTASQGIELMNKTAEVFASAPRSVLLFREMPLWGLLTAVCGLLWLCLWKGKIRLAGLPLFVFSLFTPLFTTVPDVYVRPMTAAFKNDDGLLVFREEPLEHLTKINWLTDNRQNEALTMNCPDGLCLYEKNGWKIAVANTKTGAYDACRKKDLDILFLTSNVEDSCPAKKIIGGKELSKEGTYTLFLTPEGIRTQTVLQKKGFRPWSTSYPLISLKTELYMLTRSSGYGIHAAIEKKD